MSAITQDFRFASRAMLRSRGLTTVAVITLGLGISLTTAMFSIVRGVVLRGLPFPESEQILHLERSHLARDITSMEVSHHDFIDWREQQRSFEDIAAFYVGTVNLSGTERAERFEGAFITSNAFELLRVRPLLGRAFRPGEDAPGAAPVIILSYEVWQNRYGGDPDIVGKAIRTNGEPATVVGVMPAGFAFPLRQEVWVPLRQDPTAFRRGAGMTLEVYGRLRDGVSPEQALTELAGIARRLELEYPESNRGIGVVMKPFVREYIGEDSTRLMFVMLGAVGLVLLIACFNVANLLLAKSAVRSKEIAVRSALGASRLRVILSVAAEGLVLASMGAVLGTALGWVLIRLFNMSIAGTNPPFWLDIRVDPAVLLFVVSVTVGAGLVAGLIPAIKVSRTNLNDVLKDESRGTTGVRIGRLSRALVIGQVALSCGLLVGAGLMIRSVGKLGSLRFPFTTEDVLTARVGLFETDYPTEESRIQFFEQLQARLRAAPGVISAAVSSDLPVNGAGGDAYAVDGKTYASPDDYPFAHSSVVSPGFFETFAVRPLEGREFDAGDREGSLPVALVNQSFARKAWGNESPIGRTLRLGRGEVGGGEAEGEEDPQPWRTVVGVVPDMFMDGLENEEPEGIYVPLGQSSRRFMSIVVRGRGDPAALTETVREQVSGLDADLPIYFVMPMREVISRNTFFLKLFGVLFMIFGGVALLLAAVGIYGVMAFAVTTRTQEVGVRMALGAQTGDVLRLILRSGAWQIGIGLGLGLLLAWGVSRLIRTVLFQVQPTDPVTFVGIAVVLSAVGLLACVVPARRAARVDPVIALRYE